MSTIRFILGDQLSHDISSLKGADKSSDVIVMAEVMDEATYVKHHKKKIAFIFSAMRHFAEELKEKGFHVDYHKLGDSDAKSFTNIAKAAVKKHNPEKLVVTFPGEYRVLKALEQWESRLGVETEIRDDDRFLCGIDEFKDWAKGHKQLRMEYFYRHMRKRYSVLMEGDDPVGGKWNYDSENRKTPKDSIDIPKPYKGQVDDITQEVIDLVAKEFDDHFGDLEPFYFAVTREQALRVLDKFIEERLSHFGDYQDAMLEGEAWMYHSHLSFYINIGLLNPLECINKVESAYLDNNSAPLNAVEGFIRQILGWREFIRGIYWQNMPDYAQKNYFNANRKLPWFFWDAKTDMNCLKQCITETKEHAYAHHIQRLMVLGNFTLLAGISPEEVNEWYLVVYADAFEWVEMPNVTGMILFADGGVFASKPYAAGGSYINKMSDYCKNCEYSVTKKEGEGACPFNYLYWDFLIRNKDKLKDNARVGMMYKTLERMDGEKVKAIKQSARNFFRQLGD